MLSTAAIYVTVLCLIFGAFSQNELLYQSENYCRRFVSPTITSALGLCTYPCLLWSNDQPPKILVISEPDGTVCKIYDGFRQAPQGGNCRAGFCHRSQDYGPLKRMKRDVSIAVSSSQPNNSISASQKQVQTRRDSAKPKTSRKKRIEHRRRQMWERCDCASMRGLFIDMSYVVSGLRLGRRGKRDRRRKVGCRVICLFLINKYKHDPKWASLFEARLSTPAAEKLPNATGTLPGGNRGGVNNSSNQTGAITGISTVGPNPTSITVGVNDPGSISSTRRGLTNSLTSRPSATGVLTVVPGNKVDSEFSENSNTGSRTGVSVAAGSASTSIIGGTLAIPSITSSTAKVETSNITNDRTLNNSAGAGYLGNGGANFATSTAPVESTLSTSDTETAATSGKSVTTATTTGVVAVSTSSVANPQNVGSGNSPLVNGHASVTGNGGISTGSVTVPSSPKNKIHHRLSSISAVGASNSTTTGVGIGVYSGTSPTSGAVSSTVVTKRLSKVTANATATTSTGNGTGKDSGNNDGKLLQNPGTTGSSTLSPRNTSLSSNQEGTLGSGIGNVGSGSSKEPGTRSPATNGGSNHGGSLISGTIVLLKPKVGSANGPGTIDSSGTGSGGNIAVRNETVGKSPLEANAGGLPGQPNVGPHTNTATGGRENGGVSSIAESSPVSVVNASSPGSSTNIDTTNKHIVTVGSNTPSTGTGGNPSITGTGTNIHGSVGVPGLNDSVSSGGVSSSGEGAANGISNNIGVQSGGASESSVSSAIPRGERISPTLSSSGAGVATAPETTRTPVTEGRLPVASTVPTNVIPTVTAGNGEISGATSGTAPTGIGGVRGTFSGNTTAVISTARPSEGGENLNGFPEATSTGNLIDTGSRYGAGFGNSESYGTGAISGNNPPFNFGGTYGRGATAFGSTGNEIISVPWGPAGGVFNRISAGYGNAGTFGSVPGRQHYGSTGSYGGNGRFPGGVGIYEDDIFFQD